MVSSLHAFIQKENRFYELKAKDKGLETLLLCVHQFWVPTNGQAFGMTLPRVTVLGSLYAWFRI